MDFALPLAHLLLCLQSLVQTALFLLGYRVNAMLLVPPDAFGHEKKQRAECHKNRGRKEHDLKSNECSRIFSAKLDANLGFSG